MLLLHHRDIFNFWSGRPDLHRRPRASDARDLLPDLRPDLVSLAGFAPAIFWLRTRRVRLLHHKDIW